MELWGNMMLIFQLLQSLQIVMPVVVRNKILGQECQRQDKSHGVCLDIKDCVGHIGQLDSATTLEFCRTPSLNRVIVCCHKTAAIIAREKCDEWERKAPASASPCTLTIPLDRNRTTVFVGEFPHLVSILAPSEKDGRLTHICGGSLISRNYVLTAAHCLKDNEIFVRFGVHDLNVVEPGVTMTAEVVDKILHPGYLQPSRYNDIALLKLRFGPSFRRRIRPACLPSENRRIRAGTKMVVAGWGTYENGEPASNVLRKSEVTAIDRLSCDRGSAISESAASKRYPAGITDSIICADEWESGFCTGDSGGPLMVAGASTCDVKEVVGLVSRGVVECNNTNVPGTYTHVRYYLDWIVRTVWADEL